MAKIDENLLVRGARGNVAKQFVYRTRANSTHIVKMPARRKNSVTTDKQIQIRESFAAAALYAEGALSDPELKKAYEKKASPKQSARIVAAKDYLKAPVVRSIDAGKYTGVAGSVIIVSALDDFRVAEVTVSIRTAAGVLVEEGNAILNPVDRSKWIYTSLQANAVLAGSKISVTAFDLPRNKGVLEKTL